MNSDILSKAAYLGAAQSWRVQSISVPTYVLFLHVTFTTSTPAGTKRRLKINKIYLLCHVSFHDRGVSIHNTVMELWHFEIQYHSKMPSNRCLMLWDIMLKYHHWNIPNVDVLQLWDLPSYTSFYNINTLDQGFSNFFSEGPDETPVQPERARTVFFFFVFFWGQICARSVHHEREVPCSRGPGPT